MLFLFPPPLFAYFLCCGESLVEAMGNLISQVFLVIIFMKSPISYHQNQISSKPILNQSKESGMCMLWVFVSNEREKKIRNWKNPFVSGGRFFRYIISRHRDYTHYIKRHLWRKFEFMLSTYKMYIRFSYFSIACIHSSGTQRVRAHLAFSNTFST